MSLLYFILKGPSKELLGCPAQLLDWMRAGGFIFLFKIFFKSKSELCSIIASLAPNKDPNKSTLPKQSLHTSLKPVLKCKQAAKKDIFKIFHSPKKKNDKKV